MLSYIVRSVIQMAGRSRVTAAGSQEKDPGWRDTALAGRWTRTAAFNQQHGPLQQGPDVVEMRYWCCVPGTRIWRHLCITVQGRKKGIPPVGWDGKSPPFFTRKGTGNMGTIGQEDLTSSPLSKRELPEKAIPLHMHQNNLLIYVSGTPPPTSNLTLCSNQLKLYWNTTSPLRHKYPLKKINRSDQADPTFPWSLTLPPLPHMYCPWHSDRHFSSLTTL